ncbi:MAG: quinone-dependent dihydroorotate dehydrogenase [Elusimicrobiota bacterium]|nr:quinone-dependent dihydroorotate dehydrogenase [Elusimicrobiota bacterium]
MIYEALKPFLFALDAERVHEEASGLLRWAVPVPGARALLGALSGPGPARARPVEAFGLRFPNPIGLAAGFDKDGRLASVLPALGFGFVEIGSVTLDPQPGNPRPRLFRLPGERGLLNRMGFNSAGAREVARILAASPRPRVPLGINLGLNKGVAASEAPARYARTFRILQRHGDYFVVNVSSPNTPGLRSLQGPQDLVAILGAVREADTTRKPLLVKLSPDLDAADLEATVRAAAPLVHGFIVSNTTVSRDGLDARWKAEAGGVSGAPLKARALTLLKTMRALTDKPLVAAGGIETVADALERLRAGATLLQLYTGLVYGGPGAVKRMLRGLEA